MQPRLLKEPRLPRTEKMRKDSWRGCMRRGRPERRPRGFGVEIEELTVLSSSFLVTLLPQLGCKSHPMVALHRATARSRTRHAALPSGSRDTHVAATLQMAAAPRVQTAVPAALSLLLAASGSKQRATRASATSTEHSGSSTRPRWWVASEWVRRAMVAHASPGAMRVHRTGQHALTD